MANTICPRCSHEWEYKGSAWWITCPKCRKVMKNTNRKEDYNGTNNQH